MPLFVLLIVISVVCVEALVELAIKSEIFFSPREKIKSLDWFGKEFIGKLLSCGYCFSVWVSAFVVSAVFLSARCNPTHISYYVYIPILIVLVHRLSNYLHMLIDRVDKFYK